MIHNITFYSIDNTNQQEQECKSLKHKHLANCKYLQKPNQTRHSCNMYHIKSQIRTHVNKLIPAKPFVINECHLTQHTWTETLWYLLTIFLFTTLECWSRLEDLQSCISTTELKHGTCILLVHNDTSIFYYFFKFDILPTC